MSATTAILALILYPLLYSLPLNLIRFQWEFRQGLAPMPPDVQERAEAADRVVLFGLHLTLLAIVVFLMRGASISAHDFGLFLRNWKSAVALGALLSFVPVGMGAAVYRNLPPLKLRKQLESRGPLAEWCGLALLGSFSREFWRAFCIVALVRLDLPAWIAVLIVAVAYGASEFRAGNANAAGAAFSGILSGFLFVRTSSLAAPLTMSLITAAAYLYQVRRESPRNTIGSAPLKCPACSGIIDREGIPSGKWFPCPGCAEKLQVSSNWGWQGSICGIVGAGLTLLALRLDPFWLAMLFVPLFVFFMFLSAFVAAMLRLAPLSLTIYRGPGVPKLFRF